MERVSLTNDLSLSRIVYGMWRLDEDKDTSPAHIHAKIESCLAQGITTMDQADIYGGYMAEELLGAAFAAAPDLRSKVEVVTKCDIIAPMGRYATAKVKHYNTSRAHIEASVEHSLRLMRIEQIDLLLIHRPDPFMDPFETGPALDDLVASGKVRAVGVSNFKLHDWTLLQSAMKTPLCTNQIEISLTSNEAFTNGDIAFLQERKIAPMAWSPLGGGSLMTGDSPAGKALEAIAQAQGVDRASVAVAWLLAHPAGILPVMGTNRLDRIARFQEALQVNMDRETWFALYEAANGAEVP